MNHLRKIIVEAIHTGSVDDLYRCGYDSYSYGAVLYYMKCYFVHSLDSTDSTISTEDHKLNYVLIVVKFNIFLFI